MENDITFLRENPSLSRKGYMARLVYSPGYITDDPVLLQAVILALYRKLLPTHPDGPLINVYGFLPEPASEWTDTRCEEFLASLIPAEYFAFRDKEGVGLYQLRPRSYIEKYRELAHASP